MAQFDVYRNPIPALRDQQPFVIELQSDLLAGLETAVVAPLLRASSIQKPYPVLNPLIQVEGEALLLSPPELFSIARRRLRKPIVNSTHQRDAIVAALDRLITGL